MVAACNMPRIGRAALWLLFLASCPAMAIEPDGIIDAMEWEGATIIDDFKVTQPFTEETPVHPVSARVKAVPEGLAVVVRAEMPPEVARSRQPVQHDFTAKVDRINIMIDFEGDGRTAYDFYLSSTGGTGDAVVTNEDTFNYSWDGSWRHAISEDRNGWTAEILIPWHTAPMKDATDGKRTIRMYLDRVIASTGERAAWPTASLERSRFLSDFAAIEVPEYNHSLLAVTPYVSMLRGKGDRQQDFRSGADVFWKPNEVFQLSATLNPDFGQVESDDLVVNFSAIETFVKEKRPFFTENQSLFDFTMPSDSSQLLYTRRIGASADDGGGSSDIRAAAKVNGSYHGMDFGVLYADEDESAGRTFGAVRVRGAFGEHDLGLMMTRADRPFLDKVATVVGIDHDWKYGANLRLQSRWVQSRIKERGAGVQGTGATLVVNYDPDQEWRHQLVAMHFGAGFQINDAGFLARNDLDYLHWQISRRYARLPESSRYASKLWRWRLTEAYNTRSERLQRQLRINRQSSMRDGSLEVLQLNMNGASLDDRFMRGNGTFRRPSNFNLYGEYGQPRKGDWALKGFLEIATGGLAGNDLIGGRVGFEPTFFASDDLSFSLRLSYTENPDFLVWQGPRGPTMQDVIGRFDQKALEANAGIDWNISSAHELRVKLQALGFDAKFTQAVRIAPNGGIAVAADPVDSFNLRNLGLQVRYRYRIAPLSDLYLVYAKGGFEERTGSAPLVDIFEEALRLDEDEQFLVKISYRFEL